MATQTTNLGLTKPAYTDDADISDINDNMDILDTKIGAVPSNKSVQGQITNVGSAIAYRLGNTNTTGAALAVGTYVYVSGNSTLADGLYTVSAAIATDATLSSSNCTTVSGGGFNSVNDAIATLNSKIEDYKIKHKIVYHTITTGTSVVTKVGGASVSAGIGAYNFANEVPSGHTFVALIPSQASRASGVDVAYAIVPDNARTSIRIYGTPSVEYDVCAELLYI